MRFKLLLSLLLLLLITQSLYAQKNNPNLLILEYHHGLNTNAYTFDEVGKPFLENGLGRNFGMDVQYILPLKKKHLVEFSASWSAVNQSLTTPNLITEFGGSDNSDCCFRATSFLLFTGGVKYGYLLYKKKRLEVLGAIGLDFNIDVYTAGTGITIGTRNYWSSVDNKTRPAFYPSLDLSTRLNYHLTDKFFVTSNLSIVHAPSYALDFTYTVNSVNGIFTGVYYQRLSGSIISIGLGMKL